MKKLNNQELDFLPTNHKEFLIIKLITKIIIKLFN
jgi:hypothetical protein